MCVICVKPEGIEFPKLEILKNCFESNPDGAGFMYQKKDTVYGVKGIMTWKKFEEIYTKFCLKYDKKVPFIFHFRIGTHGLKKSPKHTHPFPLTDMDANLELLKFTTHIGIAHNGIISTYARPYSSGISDTMEFVSDILYPLLSKNSNIKASPNIEILSAILGTTNKLAILDKTGLIQLYGDFIADEGLYFSNGSYRGYTARIISHHYTDIDDDRQNPECSLRKKCWLYGVDCDLCHNYDCFTSSNSAI